MEQKDHNMTEDQNTGTQAENTQSSAGMDEAQNATQTEAEDVDTATAEKQPTEDNSATGEEDLTGQLSELRDKYLRLMAEFDNYKKRTLKEKIDLMKTAAQDTMSALLPVLDDFDRAKKMAEAEGSTEVFSEGVQLVYHKLYQVLKNRGLEPMDSQNADFDPERHDAITEIPAPDDGLKGKVMDTVEKGYLLNDKIIRYAKVVVGR